MNILIVVPARGGSKGIPHKNIYPLKGKPLLEYTLECALKAGIENADIVVSTDDGEIERVANKYPEIITIRRPKEISGDKASTESALLHALDQMEHSKGKTYDIVITMQPTSPLRKPETVRMFIEAFQKDKEHDALLTLHETRSDHWVKITDRFQRLYPEAPRRRQERQPLYIENSMLYATRAQALRDTKSVLGTCATGFVIDEIEGLDINVPLDLKIAAAYL